MRHILVPVDADPSVADAPLGLAELQAIVGGLIEAVPSPFQGLTIWCNEEGRYVPANPTNHLITVLCDGWLYAPVVGNCVITGDGPDGDSVDLTDDQIADLFSRFAAAIAAGAHTR